MTRYERHFALNASLLFRVFLLLLFVPHVFLEVETHVSLAAAVLLLRLSDSFFEHFEVLYLTPLEIGICQLPQECGRLELVDFELSSSR